MTDNTSVQVALRIRPLVPLETSKGCEDVLEVYKELNQVRIKNTDKAFTYNHVIDHATAQSDFYDRSVKDLIGNLFNGYNVTILAYGQTGSGKTHSMGTCYNGEGDMGVIPRAVSDIFEFVKDNFSYDFAISVSFIEIYQEVVYDLLSGKPRDQCCVDIREDSKGVFIPGLTEDPVKSTSEALACLSRGSQGRAVASTNMNAQSSRSHAIFTLNICMQKKGDSNLNKTAKFHLVDLAGSERSKKTGATGQTFKEGVNINKGLLALGNVISALGDEKMQNSYICYRDSCLTRLLKDSLGGNSITLMIACVSPADYNLEETISTLRYADRARKIKNKPIVNQDPKAAEINKLQKTIQQLRLELVGQGGSIICPAELELLKKESQDFKAKCRTLNIQLAAYINDNGSLYEKLHMLETLNEDNVRKIKEIKDEYSTMLVEVNNCIEKEDMNALKEKLNNLEAVQTYLTDINSKQMKIMKDIRKHETDSYQLTANIDSTSEHEISEKQEGHTAQQLALNTEFQEVSRKLAMKERLVEHIAANAITAIDQGLIADCEMKITNLEAEKEELLQQLRNVQSNTASNKVAENRRKRVQDLEGQIHDLKRKVVEQERFIKLKEKDEQKMRQLNGEILAMKQTRVELMKKIRQESEKFRIWKLQREKELHKLKDQDRKRQNQIVKMEIMHSRQQNVLKRKVEEAAALNKRLKESLAKRKAVNDIRNGKTERIGEWIQQELDVHTNILDAQITLDGLLEDRAMLQKQHDLLKDSPEMSESSEYIQLSDDIQLRSAQIADLQQKILDSQEDVRSQTRFDNIQSMGETKHALKTLFELVSDIKRSTFAAENKVTEQNQIIARLQKEKVNLDNRLKDIELINSNNERQYEEKISLLLGRVEVDSQDDTLQKILEIQKKKIQTSEMHEEKLLLENEELKRQLEILTAKIQSINDTAKLAVDKPEVPVAKVKKPKMPAAPEEEAATDSELEDNTLTDPDWRKTPLAKKVMRYKLQSSEELAQDRPKRNSEGGCTCKGNCSTRNCGCRRTTRGCGERCKCREGVCSNRLIENEQQNEKKNGTDDALKPLVLYENIFPARNIKRTRNSKRE